MVVYLLEGNIAAGKTTLCGELRRVTTERMDNNLLTLFTANPEKYAFAIQMIMQSERRATLEGALRKTSPDTGSVIDRSVVGDWAFATCNRAMNSLKDPEWAAYKARAGNTPTEALLRVTDGQVDPVCVVFLDATAVSCLERAHARGGVDVKTMTLTYLQCLEAAHLVVLASLHGSVPVVRVPWDEYQGGPGRQDFVAQINDGAVQAAREMACRQTLVEDAEEAIASVPCEFARAFLKDLLKTLL